MSVPIGAPAQRPGSSAQSPNLALTLGLAMCGLGLVSYLCSFAGEATGLGLEVILLLAGGLLAALPSLPRFEAPAPLQPIAAVISIVGALGVLRAVVAATGSVPTMVLVILGLGILQLAGAVGLLLFQAGLIKVQQKPAAPFGQPAGWGAQPGGFPQPGQPPAPSQFGQQPGAYGQPVAPGQYGQPVPPGQPGQPAAQTAFMSQPGQFTQPGGFGQSGQYGQQGQSQQGQQQSQNQGQQGQQGQSGQPGTPPGGFGGTSNQG